MKIIIFSITVILLAIACNDPEVMDPIDNDPIDSSLLEINNKWIGDYYGTVTSIRTNQMGTTYDTLHNQKVTVSKFVREYVYAGAVGATLIYNNTIIDTDLRGIDEELLADSANLKQKEGFNDKYTLIILNKLDSSVTANYSSGNPFSSFSSQGYYKR